MIFAEAFLCAVATPLQTWSTGWLCWAAGSLSRLQETSVSGAHLSAARSERIYIWVCNVHMCWSFHEKLVPGIAEEDNCTQENNEKRGGASPRNRGCVRTIFPTKLHGTISEERQQDKPQEYKIGRKLSKVGENRYCVAMDTKKGRNALLGAFLVVLLLKWQIRRETPTSFHRWESGKPQAFGVLSRWGNKRLHSTMERNTLGVWKKFHVCSIWSFASFVFGIVRLILVAFVDLFSESFWSDGHVPQRRLIAAEMNNIFWFILVHSHKGEEMASLHHKVWCIAVVLVVPKIYLVIVITLRKDFFPVQGLPWPLWSANWWVSTRRLTISGCSLHFK